jgi:hypothetical protein
VPKRRQARFGERFSTGSQVKKRVPSGGTRTPPTSSPEAGEPRASEVRQAIDASGAGQAVRAHGARLAGATPDQISTKRRAASM